MLPQDWEQQTFGQNMDWLEGIWLKQKGALTDIHYSAWAYGVAALTAIGASLDSKIRYPESYKQLFAYGEDDSDAEIVDGEVFTRTKEEREAAAAAMDREIMVERLRAAMNKKGA